MENMNVSVNESIINSEVKTSEPVVRQSETTYCCINGIRMSRADALDWDFR